MKLFDCHFHILRMEGGFTQILIAKFPDRVRMEEQSNSPELFDSKVTKRWRWKLMEEHLKDEPLIEITARIFLDDGGMRFNRYLINNAAGEVTNLGTGKVVGRGI